MNNKAVLS